MQVLLVSQIDSSGCCSCPAAAAAADRLGLRQILITVVHAASSATSQIPSAVELPAFALLDSWIAI
jgi:hypothetical protein